MVRCWHACWRRLRMSVDAAGGSGGIAAIAFSSEVDAGSREENASKQKRLKTKNKSLGSDSMVLIQCLGSDSIRTDQVLERRDWPKQVMLRNIVDIKGVGSPLTGGARQVDRWRYRAGRGQVGPCPTDEDHRPLPACCSQRAATLKPEQMRQRLMRQFYPVASFKNLRSFKASTMRSPACCPSRGQT
jgi:hypothetical protein